jgi:hypothetical protein
MLLPLRPSSHRKPGLFATYSSKARRAERKAALRRRPLLDDLEGRQMLSTFTVTSPANSTALGTLRWAITQSNETAGPNTIDFDISNPSGGLLEIKLASPLPAITTPVNVDGLFQSGSSATKPLIQIDGTSAGSTAYGLEFQKSASGTAATPIQVSGLVITDFAAGGVYLDDASYASLENLFVGVTDAGGTLTGEGNSNYGVEFYEGSHDTLSGSVVSANRGTGVIVSDASAVTLTGDFIGTTLAGASALPNLDDGVQITASATDNTIGGTATGSANVISGNMGDGVEITGSGTTGNLVEGNDIGTNSNSATGLDNYDGVEIDTGASSNTIGGTTTAARNVISSNTEDGVQIVGSGTSGNVVEGDYIGLNVGGTTALANGANGVSIYASASDNLIGGNVTGAVISGDRGDGVYVSDPGTTSNKILGDLIGTNAEGSSSVPNFYGVVIQNGATDTQVGGVLTTADDVISGNTEDGVDIDDTGTEGNLIVGDYIGVTFGGTSVLPNGYNGAAIQGGASNNTIGGTVSGEQDVLSGNGQFLEDGDDISDGDGVYISDSGTTGNLVEGDYIGTNASSSITMFNATGVLIQNGATGNTIGGTSSAARNIISGNSWAGVQIAGGASGNVVEGDYIGTNVGGSSKLGNGASGVAIYASASGNTIGGSVAGSGNVVSGNGGDGFYISGGGTNANVVEGDLIGTDYTGSVGVPNDEGVYLGGGATNNTIGGTTVVTRDVISGNTTNGVEMFSVGTAGNVVDGDYIGTSASGSSALGNGASGVAIHGRANNDTVGGTASGSGNVISGNVGNGVYIADPGTVGNVVEGNLIGTDYTASNRLGNGQNGVYIGNGATNNTIGGTATGAGNVIAANVNGVLITGSGTSDNVVEGDYIGTNASASQTDLGNTNDGVLIDDGASANEIIGSFIFDNDNNGVELDSGTSDDTIDYNLFFANANNSVLDDGSGDSISGNIFF